MWLPQLEAMGRYEVDKIYIVSLVSWLSTVLVKLSIECMMIT